MRVAAVIALQLSASVSATSSATGNCSLTNRPPRKARYLKFCQDYNADACCIPGHDLENQVQFENLIEGLGPGCKNPMMYPEVRFFYCLGCDPLQPLYTDEVAQTINVCQSFLDKMWRDPAFEDCGVMYSNPCPGPNWEFDPYMCGDDLKLPKQEYATAEEFINVFRPPGLDPYRFVAIDDTPGTEHPPCWIARTYTSSPAPRRASAGSVLAALVVAGSIVLQLTATRS